MSTETDDETIMQAWFGSPKKIAITIAGFLAIGLVAFTFIGGNSTSTTDAQQSSSNVNVATAASGHEAKQTADSKTAQATVLCGGVYAELAKDLPEPNRMDMVNRATLYYTAGVAMATASGEEIDAPEILAAGRRTFVSLKDNKAKFTEMANLCAQLKKQVLQVAQILQKK